MKKSARFWLEILEVGGPLAAALVIWWLTENATITVAGVIVIALGIGFWVAHCANH